MSPIGASSRTPMKRLLKKLQSDGGSKFARNKSLRTRLSLVKIAAREFTTKVGEWSGESEFLRAPACLQFASSLGYT
jgi:hypothetical protein